MAVWLCVTTPRASRTLEGHSMKILMRLDDLLRARESGQTMAEYAVVLAVITIAMIAALGLIGSNAASAISAIAARV
jgi:Flp pilus assembly pilin Flp